MNMTPEQRREARRNLMVTFQERVSPADWGIKKRSRSGYCSQSDMTYLLGIAVATYRAVENGERDPSDKRLLDFARICRLNSAEEEALWVATRQHPKPPRYAPMAGLRVPEEYRELVHSMTDMAYLIDSAGNVLASNKPWRDLFPNEPPTNITRWMALSEEARGSERYPRPVLMNWHQLWAESILRRLAITYNALGDQIESLSQLVKDVREDALAGPIFANISEPQGAVEAGQSTLRPQVNPDGGQRPLRHTQLGKGFARIFWMEIQGSPLSALVVVKFSKTYKTDRKALTAKAEEPLYSTLG